jgi:hypothetical protein
LPLNLTNVRNGHYRVEFGSGDSISVQIQAWRGKRYVRCGAPGNSWQKVGYIKDDGELEAWRFGEWAPTPDQLRRTRTALAVVQSAQNEGFAYLLELNYVFSVGEDRPGACVFCGQPIRTDESTTATYGPDCADARGLPWGHNSVQVEELRRRVAEYREKVRAGA